MSEFNEKDRPNWEKRTHGAIESANQNIEDEAQRDAIIQEEFAAKKAQHEKTIFHPGVIPASGNALKDSNGNPVEDKLGN